MNQEPKTMDKLLNELTETRNDLRLLQEKERILKGRKFELEARLIANLKQQGIDRVGNDKCTVSIREEIVPTVQDWDAVYTHLLLTKQFELLHKRMSATAYRELLQLGKNVPGVRQTELTRINFRSK